MPILIAQRDQNQQQVNSLFIAAQFDYGQFESLFQESEYLFLIEHYQCSEMDLKLHLALKESS